MELFQFCRTDGQPAHLHFPAGYISPSGTTLTINPVHLQECFQKILLDRRKVARGRFSLKGQAVGWGCVSASQHHGWSAGPKIATFASVKSRLVFPAVKTRGEQTLGWLKPKRRGVESLLVKLPH